MFTAEQIKAAYAKVKTGADYPRLVEDLKSLGIQSYAHIVANGSNIFYGNDHSLPLEHLGPPQGRIEVNKNPSREKLKESLSIHQEGKTDYPTFCMQAGEAGVGKWVSDLIGMKVTYFDETGIAILAEPIPAP